MEGGELAVFPSIRALTVATIYTFGKKVFFVWYNNIFS
jgi:hypothetical protein